MIYKIFYTVIVNSLLPNV